MASAELRTIATTKNAKKTGTDSGERFGYKKTIANTTDKTVYKTTHAF